MFPKKRVSLEEARTFASDSSKKPSLLNRFVMAVMLEVVLDFFEGACEPRKVSKQSTLIIRLRAFEKVNRDTPLRSTAWTYCPNVSSFNPINRSNQGSASEFFEEAISLFECFR
jgi:hypothetical protein